MARISFWVGWLPDQNFTMLIWPHWINLPIFLRAYWKTIQRETISEHIHSLTIQIDDVSDALLTAIRARFRDITVLKLYVKRADEDQLILSALSNFPPGIESVVLDLWYLSPKMNRVKWIKHAFMLKRGLFDNYPALRRATCTIAGRYMGFDWKRGDKVSTSKLVRGIKAFAYITGILSEGDTWFSRIEVQSGGTTASIAADTIVRVSSLYEVLFFRCCSLASRSIMNRTAIIVPLP